MQGVWCVFQSDEQSPTLYFGSILLNIGAFFSMSGMMTNLHGVHVALDMYCSKHRMHTHSLFPDGQDIVCCVGCRYSAPKAIQNGMSI